MEKSQKVKTSRGARARAKKEYRRGVRGLGARTRAARAIGKGGVRIDVPPRRGPGCTACSSRASKRARPCAWSWCRQSHCRCRGRVCGVRVGCGPSPRATLRVRGKRERTSERYGDAHGKPNTFSRGVARRRRDTSWLVRARRHTPRRRDLRVIVAAQQIGRGESARRTCRHARRRAGGGGRTHQASALGLLAEVVEQRGHVAEALGGIFPANRGAIRRRSVVFRSFSSVPQSHARSCFVASGSPRRSHATGKMEAEKGRGDTHLTPSLPAWRVAWPPSWLLTSPSARRLPAAASGARPDMTAIRKIAGYRVGERR